MICQDSVLLTQKVIHYNMFKITWNVVFNTVICSNGIITFFEWSHCVLVPKVKYWSVMVLNWKSDTLKWLCRKCLSSDNNMDLFWGYFLHISNKKMDSIPIFEKHLVRSIYVKFFFFVLCLFCSSSSCTKGLKKIV